MVVNHSGRTTATVAPPKWSFEQVQQYRKYNPISPNFLFFISVASIQSMMKKDFAVMREMCVNMVPNMDGYG